MDRPPETPSPDLSQLASDQDRDRAVEVLNQACSDGRLGLEDFSKRLDTALAARTMSDLASLTADLGQPAVPADGGPRGSNWFIAVMASTVRRGRWHLRPSSQAVALMGECVLDLRQAELQNRSNHILAVAVMGSINIIVPEGIDINLSGAAVMGSKELRGGYTRPLPGSPTIHVTCIALMGEVQVRVQPGAEPGDGPDRDSGRTMVANRHSRHRRYYRDQD
ncbi:MAG: DUF1707 SHOCT-like domain-containing protein [Candidatus Dormibacteria bacterium]